MRTKASATHNRFSPDPDPNLIFSIRITKPLYWWEKGGRDCGRLRRFGDSDTKDQDRISNRLCVAEALKKSLKMDHLHFCFENQTGDCNFECNFGIEQGLLRLLRIKPHWKNQRIKHNSLFETTFTFPLAWINHSLRFYKWIEAVLGYEYVFNEKKREREERRAVNLLGNKTVLLCNDLTT